MNCVSAVKPNVVSAFSLISSSFSFTKFYCNTYRLISLKSVYAACVMCVWQDERSQVLTTTGLIIAVRHHTPQHFTDEKTCTKMRELDVRAVCSVEVNAF